jgi:hypothetical protein
MIVEKIYKMQHLGASRTPLLYIGRTVLKGYTHAPGRFAWSEIIPVTHLLLNWVEPTAGVNYLGWGIITLPLPRIKPRFLGRPLID